MGGIMLKLSNIHVNRGQSDFLSMSPQPIKRNSAKALNPVEAKMELDELRRGSEDGIWGAEAHNGHLEQENRGDIGNSDYPQTSSPFLNPKKDAKTSLSNSSPYSFFPSTDSQSSRGPSALLSPSTSCNLFGSPLSDSINSSSYSLNALSLSTPHPLQQSLSDSMNSSSSSVPSHSLNASSLSTPHSLSASHPRSRKSLKFEENGGEKNGGEMKESNFLSTPMNRKRSMSDGDAFESPTKEAPPIASMQRRQSGKSGKKIAGTILNSSQGSFRDIEIVKDASGRKRSVIKTILKCPRQGGRIINQPKIHGRDKSTYKILSSVGIPVALTSFTEEINPQADEKVYKSTQPFCNEISNNEVFVHFIEEILPTLLNLCFSGIYIPLDLSKNNIRLNEQGTAVLIDFGAERDEDEFTNAEAMALAFNQMIKNFQFNSSQIGIIIKKFQESLNSVREIDVSTLLEYYKGLNIEKSKIEPSDKRAFFDQYTNTIQNGLSNILSES